MRYLTPNRGGGVTQTGMTSTPQPQQQPVGYSAGPWVSARPFSAGVAGNMAEPIYPAGGGPGAAAGGGRMLYPGQAPAQPAPLGQQPAQATSYSDALMAQRVQGVQTARNTSLLNNARAAYGAGDFARADMLAGTAGMGGNYFQNHDLNAAANARADNVTTAQAGVAGSVADVNRAGADATRILVPHQAGAIDAGADVNRAAADVGRVMAPHQAAALDAGAARAPDLQKQLQQLQGRYDSLQKSYMAGATKVAQAGGLDVMAPGQPGQQPTAAAARPPVAAAAKRPAGQVAATQPTGSAAPVRVSSQEDYDSLPPGAQYYDPAGNIRSKGR